MHEWTRAERAGSCGGCNKALAPGDPVRVTSVSGVRRKFVRCEECAGGAAPPKLPADDAPAAPDSDGFARFTKPKTRGDLRRLYGSPLRAVVND